MKKYIKKTVIYKIYLKFKKNKELKAVNKYQLGTTPATPEYKHRTIINYAKKFSITTIIETGTYLGETINATKNIFNQIYSIELDEKLYIAAKNKFSNFNHIHILNGDSSILLKKLLPKITKPCLFWLDGHFSGGITSKTDKDTPIMEELQHILNHKIKNHIILIDDARKFIGLRDYPTITTVKKIITENDKNWKIKIENDIIRIYK